MWSEKEKFAIQTPVPHELPRHPSNAPATGALPAAAGAAAVRRVRRPPAGTPIPAAAVHASAPRAAATVSATTAAAVPSAGCRGGAARRRDAAVPSVASTATIAYTTASTAADATTNTAAAAAAASVYTVHRTGKTVSLSRPDSLPPHRLLEFPPVEVTQTWGDDKLGVLVHSSPHLVSLSHCSAGDPTLDVAAERCSVH